MYGSRREPAWSGKKGKKAKQSKAALRVYRLKVSGDLFCSRSHGFRITYFSSAQLACFSAVWPFLLRWVEGKESRASRAAVGGRPGRRVDVNICVGYWRWSWELFSWRQCEGPRAHLVWGCPAYQAPFLPALGLLCGSGLLNRPEKSCAGLGLARRWPTEKFHNVACGGGDPRLCASRRENHQVLLPAWPLGLEVTRPAAARCAGTDCCWESCF